MMKVSLPRRLEDYANEKVASGLYRDTSELVEEGLRLLMQREQDFDTLKDGVTKGFQQIEAGKSIEIDSEEQFFAAARAKRKSS
jgi:putative addiction module CopG family antidote